MYLISWHEQISGSNVRAGALKTCKKKWRSKKYPEGTMKSLKWVYSSISAAICFHHNTHFNALALVFHFCRLCLCPRFFLSPPLSHDPGAPVMVFPARVSKSTLNFEIGHIRPLPMCPFPRQRGFESSSQKNRQERFREFSIPQLARRCTQI